MESLCEGLDYRYVLYIIVVCIIVCLIDDLLFSVPLSVADHSEPQYTRDGAERRPLFTRQPWILSNTQPGNTHNFNSEPPMVDVKSPAHESYLSVSQPGTDVIHLISSVPAACLSIDLRKHEHKNIREEMISGLEERGWKHKAKNRVCGRTDDWGSGLASKTNTEMFSSCADAWRLPSPQPFHWHPRSTRHFK